MVIKKPLVLVGRNGSGKSTLISFIVNALVGLKQHVYEDVEVDKGKVYRIRSPLGIHGDSHYYFARLTLDRGVSLIEWQLDKPKQQFMEQDNLDQLDPSWQRIPAHKTSYYELPLGELSAPHILEEVMKKVQFAEAARTFAADDFSNFTVLFSRLSQISGAPING